MYATCNRSCLILVWQSCSLIEHAQTVLEVTYSLRILRICYEHAAVNKTLRTLAEERTHGDEKSILLGRS